MTRLSMPIFLLTLVACAPMAPDASSKSEAPAETVAADARAVEPSAADPAAVNPSAPGAVPDAALVGGAPRTVEGGPGAGEIPPVPDEHIRVGPGLDEAACKAEAAQRFVGRSANETVVKQAVAASGAKTVRVIPHDGMVTMDYRGDRLNIQLDEQGKIVSIACG